MRIRRVYVHEDYDKENTLMDYAVLEIEGKNYKTQKDRSLDFESTVTDLWLLLTLNMSPWHYFRGEYRESGTE